MLRPYLPLLLLLCGCARISVFPEQADPPLVPTGDAPMSLVKREPYEARLVSMLRLLADPQSFENEWVQTIGYPDYSWEHCCLLYASVDDRRDHIVSNTIFLPLDVVDLGHGLFPLLNGTSLLLADFEGPVIVHGIFHETSESLFDSAGMTEVSRFSPWGPRR